MKGHIRKRSKNTWSIVIDLGRDSEGKRKQKWLTVQGTKKKADQELRKILTDLEEGTFVEDQKLTVKEYLNKWLANYAKTNVSGKTYERYAEIVKNHLIPKFGRYKLLKLQPLLIQDYYTEALTNGRIDGKGGLSPQTIKHHHRVLSEALKRAVKWKLLIRNPAEAVDPPKATKSEMFVLTEDQTATLLKGAKDSRHYLPILIAVTTGLRRGEILALRWKEIDLENQIISVCRTIEKTKEGLLIKEPKTNKGRRTVALPQLTISAIKNHRKEQAKIKLMIGPGYTDNGLIFAQPDGSMCNPDTLTSGFKAIIKKLDIPKVRLHDLRHTHASQLLRQGIHPKIVSERLGHASVSITLDIYSHLLPGMQEDAAQKINTALNNAINKK